MSPIKSPCIKVCKLDETSSYCIGCYRIKNDLFNWKDADDKEKQKIIDAANQLKQEIENILQ